MPAWRRDRLRLAPTSVQKFAALYQAALGKTVRTILDVPIQVASFAQAVELIDTRFEKGETAGDRLRQCAHAEYRASPIRLSVRPCRIH